MTGLFFVFNSKTENYFSSTASASGASTGGSIVSTEPAEVVVDSATGAKSEGEPWTTVSPTTVPSETTPSETMVPSRMGEPTTVSPEANTGEPTMFWPQQGETADSPIGADDTIEIAIGAGAETEATPHPHDGAATTGAGAGVAAAQQGAGVTAAQQGAGAAGLAQQVVAAGVAGGQQFLACARRPSKRPLKS